MVKKFWSRDWRNLEFGCWNPFSYSVKCHSFCKSLNIDVLGLTELHNLQNEDKYLSTLFITAPNAKIGKDGKSTDPAAGVAIMLSAKMRDKIHKSGSIGSRIVWVRLQGPICPIFFIVTYIPHKYRKESPFAHEVIEQLNVLLQSVPKGDCVVLCGDLNCQLRRNVKGYTGKWSMTKKNEERGHDAQVLSLMQTHDLFAVDTRFQPPLKVWNGKKRRCNATYVSKHEGRRPRKLDYFLVSNRWQSSVTHSAVKWSSANFRFGKKFDHGLLKVKWAWRLKAVRQSPRYDYAAMTEEDWENFDEELEKRLKEGDREVEVSMSSMEKHYKHLSDSVVAAAKAAIKKETKKKRYNGREMSDRTKRLHELRTRDFNSGRKITVDDRKHWNKVINDSCKKDYEDWVTEQARKIEAADQQGDPKAIAYHVNVLTGKTRCAQGKQPTRKDKGKGDLITNAEELGELWADFLEGKFEPTELERARAELEELPAEEYDELTFEEFEKAVKKMKKNKAVGPDGIPAEIWQHSTRAQAELFAFLQQVWQKECIPKNLVLGIFIMMHKKGSHNDPMNYRALCLLNHAYKILTVCLLQRLIKETSWFLSDWQAGFRAHRGCRDNILLLRVIYDNVIRRNKRCVVTYIDYTAAFDSVSHKYLDVALKKAGASRKTRALFRAIYSVAQGQARVQGVEGKRYSRTFKLNRGVVQGDIISPWLFMLALDQLVQTQDKEGQGVSVGTIHKLKVLGYADDAAMLAWTTDEMTARLTNFADKSLALADMKVKLNKAFTQIVQEQEPVAEPTEEEIIDKEQKYSHACEYEKAGCGERFKTKTGMKIHSASCKFNYGTTEESYEVESILAVFGKRKRRFYLVKWKNYPGEDSWEAVGAHVDAGRMQAYNR